MKTLIFHLPPLIMGLTINITKIIKITVEVVTRHLDILGSPPSPHNENNHHFYGNWVIM